MGAGRRTFTYVVDSRADAITQSASVPQVFAECQRCLGKSLGGVIFGCTDKTFKECIDDRVFGLPKHHMLYVKDITPGLPIFLFNYNGRHLYGVFRATSRGMMNAKPHGWTDGTDRPTQFPAQVRVEVLKKCAPIQEKKFKGVIEGNYSDDHHFVFELDKQQVKRLCELFKYEGPNLSLLTRQPVVRTSHTKPSEIRKAREKNGAHSSRDQKFPVVVIKPKTVTQASIDHLPLEEFPRLGCGAESQNPGSKGLSVVCHKKAQI